MLRCRWQLTNWTENVEEEQQHSKQALHELLSYRQQLIVDLRV